MIRSLRKRHLQIWILWAVLLPAGIIVAWMAVPEKVTQELLQEPGKNHLPVLIKSVDTENYTVNLKTNKNRSKYQLEWLNKEGSAHPSTLIYKISQPENELIGRVEAKGKYRFNLPNYSSKDYSFILYDIIGKRTIDSLKFPL